MADCIAAEIDHVAIAVPDWRVAETRWRDALGGGRSSAGGNTVFTSRQLLFANGAKIELLAPAGDDPGNFVRRFLDRFGSTVHHLTMKVPDLLAAIDVLAGAGIDAVDVNAKSDYWKEAFLRPSQVGGLVVQLAQTPFTDDQWADYTNFTREPPAANAAALLGPLLHHPDLAAAADIWTVLGATVATTPTGLECSWPNSAITVAIEKGPTPGPVALRMHGAGDLPQQDGVGPLVVETER